MATLLIVLACVLGYLLIGYGFGAVWLHRAAKAREACESRKIYCEEQHAHDSPLVWIFPALGWPIYALYLVPILAWGGLGFVADRARPDKALAAAAQQREAWRKAQEEKRRGKVIDVPGVEPITDVDDCMVIDCRARTSGGSDACTCDHCNLRLS